MQVFVDLWGVLLDSTEMERQYRERLADLFERRFGASREAWLDAHDRAYAIYSEQAMHLDPEAGPWNDVVDRLDAELLLSILREAGVSWRPDDPVAFSRQSEAEVMSGINARFPDARTAIERLRKAGHRVYVATQSTTSSASAALDGARLLDTIDGMFTGTSQNAPKSRRAYWDGLPDAVGAPPGRSVVIDDRFDYLEPAASVGFVAILLDRKGIHSSEPLPRFVEASLRNLAGLPHFIDVLDRAR